MAGAYCKFCGRRCFVYRIVPDGPSKGWGGHMATCPDGMALDLKAFGHTHETAVNPVTDGDAAEAVAAELAAETDEEIAARLGYGHGAMRSAVHSNGCCERWRNALAVREHCRASHAAESPAPANAPVASARVFTWDHKAQPPFAEIFAAAQNMPAPWFWFCPETGTQEYAFILSDRELTAVEAERILWETVEG